MLKSKKSVCNKKAKLGSKRRDTGKNWLWGSTLVVVDESEILVGRGNGREVKTPCETSN